MQKAGKKIAVIGAGNVGATIAYTLTMDGMASEIVIVDVNKEKARGEAMDIAQGTSFTQHVQVYSGDYPDIKDSDIIVLTAGIGRKPGQTRIELIQTNIKIIESIVPEIVKYAPEAVILVVSNPVDILTYAVTKFSGLPERQILGTGTILDTARLRESIGAYTGVPSQNIHAYVLGEHGDTSMIPWSNAAIAGMPIATYFDASPSLRDIDNEEIFNKIISDVRTSGGKVIADKGATYYAIGLSVRKLCKSIIRNTNNIHPVSTMLNGQYGIDDVCVSLPATLNSRGVGEVYEIPLNNQEKAQFIHSANTMNEVIKSLKI